LSPSRIPAKLRRQVLAAARNKCAYCRSEERLMGVTFEIEHIVPRSKGGKNSIDNLCLSCPPCNHHKSKRVRAVDPVSGAEARLFHPLHDRWSQHFAWSDDGTTIRGLTNVGRTTIDALKMNRPQMIELRGYWLSTGQHPLDK
jgi:hypothetical protein